MAENHEEIHEEIKEKDKPTWRELDLSGNGIRALGIELFRYDFLTALHVANNNLSTIPAGIARLTQLVFLDLSYNRIVSLPREIAKCTRLQEILLFHNLIATFPAELALLSDLNFLGLDDNPLQEPFSSLKGKGTRAIVQWLRDNSREFVPPPPEERTWIPFDAAFSNNNEDPDVFTVFSYNILCPSYATEQIYPYCPTWALNWDYRKERILDEIFKQKADIFCLQEIDAEQYEIFFKVKLQRQGYQGVFCPKTRAKTMGENEAKLVDGSAIFYRESKFAFLKERKVEFSSLSTSRQDFRSSQDIFNRVMPKDNVAMVVLLKFKQTGLPLIVANPHITWDPFYKDVKLIQTTLLMEELEDFRMQFPTLGNVVGFVPNSRCPAIPTVICGDFNSSPDSGVYTFLSTGTLPKNHTDFGKYKYGNYTTTGLAHNFELTSAYSVIGEPPFTNHTPTFKGTIDYIWHTISNLRNLGVLGPISDEYAAKTLGFPNPHFPSDHISLAAQFKLNLPYQRRNPMKA